MMGMQLKLWAQLKDWYMKGDSCIGMEEEVAKQAKELVYCLATIL